MDQRDAIAMLEPAVGAPGGVWADLGAGGGTFTRALATLLGASATVHAVDRDRRSVEALRRLADAPGAGARVLAVDGDFTAALALPALDGALLANALHFVPYAEQPAVLARVVEALRPGGRVVLVEYERRAPSQWVPYPIEPDRFASLAATAGLEPPRRAASRRSAYGGSLYSAFARGP